jgi:spermidine synthase
MSALGRHILVELYNCEPELLNDVVHIEKSMERAASTAGATIINSTFHHFSPYGVSGVVVIQESHLAFHSWPEYGFAAIDLFTCGDTVDPWIAYDYLKTNLKASHGSAMQMMRGEMGLLSRSNFESGVFRDETEASASIKRTRDIWFTERNNELALSLKHKGEKIYDTRSDYQHVEIYDTLAFGRMLTLDGMVMTSEKDEYVYHEMIAHVPALVHPSPRKVLVIGGGDGGTIRELLKHSEIEKIVLVEIDKKVIEASQKYLPTIGNQLNHPKLEIKIEDGIRYVENCKNDFFDIVVVDSTDPVGPGEGLFKASFYEQVYTLLSRHGIMVTQSESPRFNQSVFKEIFSCYREIFEPDNVHCYLAYIPTYPSGMWSFSFCSKGELHPIDDLDLDRQEKLLANYKLSYYNEDIHKAAFALPGFVKDQLQSTVNA